VTLPSPAFPSRMAGSSGSDRGFFFFSDDRFPRKVVNAPELDPLTTPTSEGMTAPIVRRSVFSVIVNNIADQRQALTNVWQSERRARRCSGFCG
jgi:hypothetical protein